MSNFKQPKVRRGNKTYTQEELQLHRKERQMKRNKHKDKYYNDNIRWNRDGIYTAFYHSPEWQKRRQQALIRDNYLCQYCLKHGVVNDKNLLVHHIVELKYDWDKRLDLKNLETVCRTCHNRL